MVLTIIFCSSRLAPNVSLPEDEDDDIPLARHTPNVSLPEDEDDDIPLAPQQHPPVPQCLDLTVGRY